MIYIVIHSTNWLSAVMAERLRRQTRNLFGSPSAGSNPAHCEVFFSKLQKVLGDLEKVGLHYVK